LIAPPETTVLITEPATEMMTEPATEIFFLNPFPEHWIPLENGYFAEDLGDGLFRIYDEDGIPLGYVLLEEGASILDWDDFDSLLPTDALFVTVSTGESEPPKPNPKTSDYFIALLSVCASLAAIKIYYVYKKRSPK